MTSSSPTLPGRAPRRMALLLAWITAALLVLGGLVTTYRVGMAVTDWPTTFGYSMFAYPLDRMIEDWGVTVEHSHRLLASVVGLASLVLVLVTAAGSRPWVVALTGLALALEAALVMDVISAGQVGGPLQVTLLVTVAVLLLLTVLSSDRRASRGMAILIHLGIIGQGLLGGTRVLDNSEQLAFLHGSAAQLVFLAVAMGVVVTAPRYMVCVPVRSQACRGLTRLAVLATALVYVQIVLGAWLRHSGLPAPLMLHMGCAFAAVGAVLLLARKLKSVVDEGEAAGADRSQLRRVRSWMLRLVSVQILLGIASLAAIQVASGGFAGRVSALEALTSSAHVLVGALLLGSCAAAGLWSARLLVATSSEEPARAPLAVLEGGAA